MIRLKNVQKYYNTGTGKFEVLKNISLTIEDNSYISIVGPSGSGKSTLLHVIGGLEEIDKGEIWVNNEPVHLMKDKALSKLRSEHVSYIFQHFHLIPTATALENVMMPFIKTFTSIDLKNRARKLLERVGLEHRINYLPSRMSGGEQQRVAIARALFTNPQIILADEPTGNLDTDNGVNIINLLEEIHTSDGVTIVLVTHDELIANRADRKINLIDGEIKEEIVF